MTWWPRLGQDRTRLEATVALGDAEALEHIRERAEEVEVRPPGATVLLDASIRPPPEPKPGPGEPSPSGRQDRKAKLRH